MYFKVNICGKNMCLAVSIKFSLVNQTGNSLFFSSSKNLKEDFIEGKS